MADGPFYRGFCADPLWDYSLTWNTTDPDFTQCFQTTVAVWVPAFFLWAALPFQAFRILHSRWKEQRWTWLPIAKVALCLALFAVCAADLGITASSWITDADYASVGNAVFFAALIQGSSFLLAAFFVYTDRRSARSSSAVLFIFWLLTLLGCIIRLRGIVRRSYTQDLRAAEMPLNIVALILISIQLILTFLAQKFDARIAGDKNPSPEISASFPIRYMYAWFTPMAILGYRKPLEFEDLWDLRYEEQVTPLAHTLEKYWSEELEKHRKKNMTVNEKKPTIPSLTKVWFKTVWVDMILSGLLKLAIDLIGFIPPQLLQLLIAFAADMSQPEWKGYIYAVAMFAATFTQSTLISNFMMYVLKMGSRSKAGFTAAIYRKALRITSAAKRSSTVGEIVNLMAVDTQKFFDLAHSLHSLWASPLQVGISLYFLYQQLGVSIFAGLGFMILLVPINTVTAIAARKFQVMQMKEKDKRIKLTNEVLNGIKVLKLYAWEESFEKQISDIRENEMRSIQKAAFLTSMTFFVWTVSPFLVALVTFATYIFMDESNVLDTQKAFVSLSLFNILRQPLTNFPLVITSLVQARVSIDRIARFLTNEELDPDNVRLLAKSDPAVAEAVLVKNGEFAWDQKDASTLQNVNVEIKPGQLVAVVGKVGAGKSSLVSAMLGMMEKKRGEVTVKGTISYVSQQAWIQNMTVQQNILFGKPMDRERYDRVIKCCALEPDLLILQNGDQTQIGEKGLNLSGGQKQRISLARAVYADADVCFLDDPLSAVDAHVGKQLFEQVIGPKGLLAGKTRILVTHGVSFLPQADNILVIEDGEIAETGTYKTLLNNNGSFSALLRSYLSEMAEDDEADVVSVSEDVEPRSRTSSTATLRKVRRTFSKISQKRSSMIPEKVPEKQVLKPDAALVEEKMEVGNVKWNIFVSYMRYMTYPVFFSMIAGFSAYNALNVYSNVWLGDWSEDAQFEERRTDPSWRDYRLGVYGGIGGALGLTYMAACLMNAVGQVYASRTLHRGMLRRVLHAPMAFFDTTPLGRIINRFSKDIEAIDLMLPMSLMIFLSFALSVLATIIFICVIIPYFAAVIVPLAILYFFIQRFYIATSRQLKRLDSASRSPIFSHFQESITGTTTIIATRQTERFMHENDERVDHNNKAAYANLYSQRWVAVMLEFMGNLIILFAAIFAVVGRGNGLVEPKETGLILNYTLSVTSLLNWLVRMTSEVENHLVSIERVQEYTEIAQEAEWVRPDKRPPKNWPHEGKVVFDNYQARYRPELDLVLTGVNADISAGEKIGIVGRTGAGKSSLTLALFRIVEPAGGSIIIDNIDLTSMGLHDVRSHLTIIPQEPVLFSGTLRMNLDPFDKYTDEAVWQALNDSHLKTFVSTLTDGLQHVVAEGGENLSVGQRQLLCLARALLKKTKILIMDEATAAIDLQTDELIQKTIREKFVDCTVLTIAHRLNTVMDSTRIMVMDQGKIVEFAPPAEMLKDTNSVFYSLAKHAGLV